MLRISPPQKKKNSVNSVELECCKTLQILYLFRPNLS